MSETNPEMPLDTTEAQEWADAYRAHNSPGDEDAALVTWFANAIEAGRAAGVSESGVFDGVFASLADLDTVVAPVERGGRDAAPASDQMTTTVKAMDHVKAAMQADYDYAWAWHCQVACAALDEGVPHEKAQLIASRAMAMMWGVDTTKGEP